MAQPKAFVKVDFNLQTHDETIFFHKCFNTLKHIFGIVSLRSCTCQWLVGGSICT